MTKEYEESIAGKYLKFAHETDANNAYLTCTLLITSVGHGGTAEDRVRDLIELQRIHLANTGLSSLGWAISGRFDGEDKTKGGR